MAFYKAGTANVTQGSQSVVGVGTQWVANAPIGQLFLGPDGLPYEIVNVPSDTQLTIEPAYRGASANGQSYRIVPTQGYLGDAARQMADLIASFAAVRDGIGQGLIPNGTVAAPGLRFLADQDTGIYRPQENALSIVLGGIARFGVTPGEAVAAVGILSVGPTVATAGTGGQFRHRDDTATTRWATGVPNVAGATRYFIFDLVNNVEAVSVMPGGNVGVGTAAPTAFGGYRTLHVYGPSGAISLWEEGGGVIGQANASGGAVFVVGTRSNHPLALGTNNVERARFDTAGNFQVGGTGGDFHRLEKNASQGSPLLYHRSTNPGAVTILTYAVAADNWNTAATAVAVGRNTSTNRSINAAGTMNASGADYAEYMRKASACGVLAKGQIVGIDADGQLTDKFSLAHSFVVKSTNPAYVGGDNWSPGPPPAEPVFEPSPYDGPPEPSEPGAAPPPLSTIGDRPAQPERQANEDDLAFIMRMAKWIVADAAWVTAMDQRPSEVEQQAMALDALEKARAAYAHDLPLYEAAQAAHAAAVAKAEAEHAAALTKHAKDYAVWAADMERCRATVDRIAFSGQVPCNVVAGSFHAGDYIVGVEGEDDTIVGLVVTNATMRLTPGLRCDAVGKVWRTMDDGRAWVAVLIG